MEALLAEVQYPRPQHAQRLTEHVLAQLACLGDHTVTGLLTTLAKQFQDWSADYRMYNRDRVSGELLFDVVRRQLCALDGGPVVVAMDDTRTKRTGRKVEGATYTRDPLSPPFHVNFIRAQRFVQASMALKGKDGQARMLPVDWVHAPLPAKPSKKASEAEREAYRKQRELSRLSLVGAQRIEHLRGWMDKNDCAQRRLWVMVDGSYTNGTVLKKLPPNTTLVGRINKKAKLYCLPQQQLPKGRNKLYGELAPTPEALREDENHPWQEVEAFFGGEKRPLRVKRLGPVRWRAAGAQHDLQLLVIAPTSYQLSKQSPRLYRQPAYLICTDPNAPIEEIVQHYLWRWDIEVNFRDEKTLLGVGEAQVRKARATQNVTSVAVAAYAMLLLAAHQSQQAEVPPQYLPPPRWQNKEPRRATTAAIIRNLRHELWGQSVHFSGFEVRRQVDTKPEKCRTNMESAVFYAARH